MFPEAALPPAHPGPLPGAPGHDARAAVVALMAARQTASRLMTEQIIPETGETPTLRRVFDEHAAFVMRTVRRLGVREADVEDVAQDVFVVVHRKLPQYDPARPMRAWLAGIARRVVSDYRRKASVRRERPDDESPQLAAVDGNQERDVHRRQAREVLDAALDQLREDQRSVFVLYELEGMPMAQIAEAMETPLQTAYSRLRVARERVAEHVRGAFGTGESQ